MGNFFQNTRKPKGLGGKIMLSMMNSGHAALARWGFSHIEPKKDAHVLDIGCGGGANIATLLTLCSDGLVEGIDYSELSVEKSIKVNKAAVDAGKCKIVQGNVNALPYQNETFDLVTAFETIYFWPDIENAFKDIYNILKPGGQFMITNEVDGEQKNAEKWQKIIDGMTVYRAADLKKMLIAAGYSSIVVDVSEKKSWLSIIAKK